MESQKINQQFREDEIANIRRWDKERNEYITNPFPKIAGRLRLAHEANEALSIETEIIRYDEQVAVVCAVSKTSKGNFKGIGMASIERDQKLAHAILELAETRAIARSLRFAGYGIEYCSAEEMPITENGNGNGSGGNGSGSNGANGNGNGGGNGSDISNGNGNGRLSAKQYRLLAQLSENQGRTKADLDKQAVEMFGTVAQFLSKGDASRLIEHLLAK